MSTSVFAQEKTVVLAGGCFWCVEADLEKVKGIKKVISGYADGNIPNPTYSTYNKPKDGQKSHLEVVKVYYDDNTLNYADLIKKLLRLVDPTDKKGQFVDRGIEYRPAIFYKTQKQKQIAQKIIKNYQKYFTKPINIDLIKEQKFYKAENYHQNYYKKNPIRYKFYRYRSGRDQYLEKIWGNKKMNDTSGKYQKPSIEQLKQKLTDLQFKVTQKDATEPPFENEYWDNKQKGIYVDITTGEPLFSSLDKFDSGTGWPSFTKPIEENAIVQKLDFKLIYPRKEIRGRISDAHLGHLFNDGPREKGGKRYCINSASLKFIPVDKLAENGYQNYENLFK